MISFFDLFYFLNATLVWHVATALCNIQQHEDWENDNCLDVIMCLLKFAVAPPSSSQWVSMWPSLMYFVTKSGFLLGDSYWWVSNYELMVYYVKIHFELKKKDLLLQSLSSFLHVLTCRTYNCYCWWTNKGQRLSWQVCWFISMSIWALMIFKCAVNKIWRKMVIWHFSLDKPFSFSPRGIVGFLRGLRFPPT